MIAPQQRFFDETYQKKQHQLQLFLQLSRDHLLLTRFDESKKMYVEFEQYTFHEQKDWYSVQKRLEHILAQPNLQEGKNHHLSFSDAIYTLVPKALFDPNKLEHYIRFNHELTEDASLCFYANPIDCFDAVVVYAIPRGLDFLAKAKLPAFNWTHHSLALLEAIHFDTSNFSKLNIHIQQQSFDLIYAPEGKLKFFNSFNYTSAEDFIYFLLYVMEQLNLNREEITVKLFGEFEENSSIYQTLYTYIRKVEIGKRPAEVNFSTVLSELPQHYYFNLFNQHLCG